MNLSDVRNAVVAAIQSVAPETEPAALDDSVPFREALDLDSMDFLNVLVGLHQTLHVDIPEADYGKVQTLGGIVTYLANKLGPVEARPSAG
jgi:acyl carrier protein